MAEKRLDWPSDLGYGRVEGRFGWISGDASDADIKPDLSSVTGTVTIKPSVNAVKYSGVLGNMLLVAKSVQGVLDDDGYLCTIAADGTAGPRGLVLPATDNTKLTPTGFTYEVSVVLNGYSVTPFSINIPTNSVVDLIATASVPVSGGTATVVDVSTAVRAETAAGRAEAVLGGISQAIRDALDSDVYKGPKGDPGSKGDPGPKGNKGDPGAIPTAASYFVSSAGRPDVPTSTSFTEAQLNALPIGCQFTSTNESDGTGALIWHKGLSGWKVTRGDTGWRNLKVNASSNTEIFINRNNNTVTVLLFTDGSLNRGTVIWDIANGFRTKSFGNNRSLKVSLGDRNVSNSGGLTYITGNYGSYHALSTPGLSDSSSSSITWIANDSWPPSLPGSTA